MTEKQRFTANLPRLRRISSPLIILIVLLTVALPCALAAAPLKAKLIVIGPGDPIYTRWGHIGIAIDADDDYRDRFYDFGNFSPYAENFYTNFAMGRMLYLGLSSPTDLYLEYAMQSPRSITVYPLGLGEEEVIALEKRLRWWVQPENREYLYDYYYNNCSTIIRDVLNEVSNGALEQSALHYGGISFRDHTRIGTHDDLPSQLFLDFLIGPGADKIITGWETMFLPEAVAQIGAKTPFTSQDGITRNLVEDGQILAPNLRAPQPKTSPRLWPRSLMIGILLAILWSLSRQAALTASPLAKWGAFYRGLVVILIGSFGGALGFLMVFTNHDITAGNLNIGPAFPTILLALPFLWKRHHRCHPRRLVRREFRLALVMSINFIGLVLAMVFRITGMSSHEAQAIWGLLGPLLLVGILPLIKCQHWRWRWKR